MEYRSFEQVSSTIVLNKSNIRHKRDNCRKTQILLLLLCCLNGSLKESPCWTPTPRVRLGRNVLEGGQNAMDVVNISCKSEFLCTVLVFPEHWIQRTALLCCNPGDSSSYININKYLPTIMQLDKHFFLGYCACWPIKSTNLCFLWYYV